MPTPPIDVHALADPYDDLPEAAPGADETPAPGAVLPALWAMLARPEVGAASTLPALRSTLALRLADALHRSRSPVLDVATALAELLTLGARDAARFSDTARLLCREAVERLMLALDAGLPDPEPARRFDVGDGLAPLVVTALGSRAASRRVRVVLEPLGVTVCVASTAHEALRLLAETPAELVVTEHGLFDPSFGALRRLPLHIRTPILAFCGPELPPEALAAVARQTAGVRRVPRPRSRAEFVLQVRLSLFDT